MTVSRVSRILPAFCLGTALLTGSAASAWAFTLCIPEATGLDWWSSAATTPVHAPFKQGAVASTSADGKAGVTSMLWDPDADQIVVRVQLWGATGLDPAADRFVLALSEDGVLPSLFLQFHPLQGCADADACGGRGVALSSDAVEYSEATSLTSLTWSPLSTTNPSAAFSIEHPWIAVEQDDSGPVTTYDWTLTFALNVPVDGAGQIVDNLAAYGSIIEYEAGPTSATHVELPMLCDSSSPTTDTCSMYGSVGNPQLPADLPTNVAGDWLPLVSSCGAP